MWYWDWKWFPLWFLNSCWRLCFQWWFEVIVHFSVVYCPANETQRITPSSNCISRTQRVLQEICNCLVVDGALVPWKIIENMLWMFVWPSLWVISQRTYETLAHTMILFEMDRSVIVSHPQHSLNENRSSQLDHAPVFPRGHQWWSWQNSFNLTASDHHALYCMSIYKKCVTWLNGRYLDMNGWSLPHRFRQKHFKSTVCCHLDFILHKYSYIVSHLLWIYRQVHGQFVYGMSLSIVEILLKMYWPAGHPKWCLFLHWNRCE